MEQEFLTEPLTEQLTDSLSTHSNTCFPRAATLSWSCRTQIVQRMHVGVGVRTGALFSCLFHNNFDN